MISKFTNWYTHQRHRCLVDFLTVFGAIGATIAASFAAYYTYQQWQASEKTLQATIRPYIKVELKPETFEIRKPPQGSRDAICVNFTIENTGKLPALLNTMAGVEWSPSSEGRNGNWPKASRGYGGSVYLFEKQNIEPALACSRELTPGEMDDFKNAKNRDIIAGIKVLYSIPSSNDHDPFVTKICTEFHLQDGPLLHLSGPGGPCGNGESNPEPNNFAK